MESPIWLKYVSTFAEVAMAIGIFFAWWQIRISKKLAMR